MSSEKFCLRWNDFETNISDAFRELREEKDFFDVTLACGNEQIQAHKVILSACSTFFRNILRRNVHQHPLVYLKGVKFGDLQSVLNFMYHGEVSVAQEELNSFLAVAEDLMVKGLTQNHSESQKIRNERTDPKPKTDSYSKEQSCLLPREPRLQPPKRQKSFQPTHSMANNYSSVSTTNVTVTATDLDDDIQEVVPVKSEPVEQPGHSSTPVQGIFTPSQESQALTTAEDTFDYPVENFEEYEQYEEHQEYQGGEGAMSDEQLKGCHFQDPSDLLQFVTRSPVDGRYHCTLCDKFSHQNSSCSRNHVESNHFPTMFSYPCDQCEQIFTTKTNFNMHRSRKHKPNRKQ
eukprot:GFUD01034267.1.p1 GENE.GFUD01034267.1~~GFUD01034267.1.p1  ORF type:complete len:347 (+),score=91.25 GFUD01034267.1:161-1201(+)